LDDNARVETEQKIEAVHPETKWLSFRHSPIHGFGGFARRDIASGVKIIEYLGETISKQESLRRCEQSNEFIFTLDESTDLDGNVAWNPARLLNHSCAPNCDAEFQEGQIWIVSRRLIRAGEEITFNYGYDLVDYREYPCHCHAPNCVGFIIAEELFDKVGCEQVP
jgi:SET domain-containing protein